MKKVLLSLAAVFAFGLANAQETESNGFAKGDVFLSGTVGFSSESTGDAKTTGFNIAPSAGYFVNENIAVGLSLGYNSLKNEVPSNPVTSESKYTSFGVGAFGRYYFTPGNSFSLFGQLGVGYESGKLEQNSDESKTDSFNIGVAPGINYFVSEHFALEATFGILGYSTSKPDFDGADSTNSFDFGLNLDNINFGIVYKF